MCERDGAGQMVGENPRPKAPLPEGKETQNPVRPHDGPARAWRPRKHHGRTIPGVCRGGPVHNKLVGPIRSRFMGTQLSSALRNVRWSNGPLPRSTTRRKNDERPGPWLESVHAVMDFKAMRSQQRHATPEAETLRATPPAPPEQPAGTEQNLFARTNKALMC